ncbi:hypothetical protein AYI70_g1991 [Smittium culicis]|uniref:Anoctamin transmembrane domain-containing protein n=1 Tax=Smittium culicis TaxID=133412 RepID=A0A1R1YAC1_9FUNG|nr:hypothetical protein AYI70_g1991 [Smittium culicis]
MYSDKDEFCEYFDDLNFMKNSSEYSESVQKMSDAELLSPRNGSEEFKSFSDFVIVFDYSSSTKNSILENIEGTKIVGSLSKFASKDKSVKIRENFESIVKKLTNAGLSFEVRQGIKKFKTLNNKLSKLGSNDSSNESSESKKISAISNAEIKVNPTQILLFISCSKERIELEYKRMALSNYRFNLLKSENPGLNTSSQNSQLLSDSSFFDFDEFTPSTLLSTASRQRIVHRIISGPVNQGCADIRTDNEKYVSAVFPLHDKKLNSKWIKSWSSKIFITDKDLMDIRLHFGEETAIYFAYLQFYFRWLSIPAILGFITYFLSWQFSAIFSILLMLWSLFFTHAWKLRESELARNWGLPVLDSKLSNGMESDDIEQLDYRLKVNQNDFRRSSFKPDHFVVDPVTNEKIPVYDSRKRFLRQLLGIPIMIFFLIAMFFLVAVFFAFQVFMEEIYNGPLAGILTFLPTVCYSLFIPVFNNFCEFVSLKLTEFENYEYQTDFKYKYNQKIFLFRFLQDQGYLLLLAWVFIPLRLHFEVWSRKLFYVCLLPLFWSYSHVIGLFSVSANSGGIINFEMFMEMANLKESSTPAAEKLQTLLIYFILTAQLINQFTLSVLPGVMKYWKDRNTKVNNTTAQQHTPPNGSPLNSLNSEIFESNNSSQNNDCSSISTSNLKHDDSRNPNGSKVYNSLLQAKFVYSVTEEAGLVGYDVYNDYAEMVTQFGYVSFYSVIWPVAPLISLINNFFELRADAFKICENVRKPVPVLTNTIGPWLETLTLTSWIGSVVNSLLVYQFNPVLGWLFPSTTASDLDKFGRTSLVAALIVAVVAEHFFLLCNKVVIFAVKSCPGLFSANLSSTCALKKERNRRTILQQSLLDFESLGIDGEAISKDIELSNAKYLKLGDRLINQSFKAE